jgi:hypothetical protein
MIFESWRHELDWLAGCVAKTLACYESNQRRDDEELRLENVLISPRLHSLGEPDP